MAKGMRKRQDRRRSHQQQQQQQQQSAVDGLSVGLSQDSKEILTDGDRKTASAAAAASSSLLQVAEEEKTPAPIIKTFNWKLKLDRKKITGTSPPPSSASQIIGSNGGDGGGRGILKLSHLHNNFGERQLRQFCREFGEVLRIRLLRSKKTGGSLGRAYVEFKYFEVAEIVARALNGYYLGGEVIRAKVLGQKTLSIFNNNNNNILNNHQVGSDIQYEEMPSDFWDKFRANQPPCTRSNFVTRVRRISERRAQLPLARKQKLRQLSQCRLLKKLAALGLDHVYQVNKNSSDGLGGNKNSSDGLGGESSAVAASIDKRR